MLSFALELADKTDGYFDPTIGSVLSRLGYGKKDELDNIRKNSYRDVRIEGDQVYLMSDVFLEFG
jgi:thiamine biosynthesis lipoprotein ApbE